MASRIFFYVVMKTLCALFLFAIILAPSPEAHAGLQEANNAYRKGAYSVALEEFKRLATDGEVAQYTLGVMYANGQGVPQDYKTALSWFRKAAEQGNASAQYRLGVMYAKGQGVAQDNRKAAQWFYKAGVQGDSTAQYRVGVMYANGLGLTQNYKEAALWYGKAAEQGQANAQNNLGVMYNNGQGVPRDLVQAYKWVSLACAGGDLEAVNNKKVAEANMTPRQIAEAESMVRDWLALRGVVALPAQGQAVKNEGNTTYKKPIDPIPSAPVSQASASNGKGATVTDETRANSALSVGGTLIGGIWNTSRQLDDNPSASNATLRVHGQLPLSDVFSMKLDGVLGADSSRSKSNSLHQVREGYIQRKSENSEFRLGRQLIVWGRADKLNPTDYFSSRDYTFLTSDDEEQKNGVDAMRTVAHFGKYDLQGVVAHGNAKNIWPFNLANNVDSIQSNKQFGAKLDRFGEGLDWSASYYHGMDRNPNLLPNLSTGAIVSSYDNVSAIGLDFAAASGALSYRGEAAYFKTSDSAGGNLYRRNNHLDFVFGVDGSPSRDANLGIQYYGVAVNHYSPNVLSDPIAKSGAILGNQLRAYQHGITLRFAQNWLNDALQFEMRANFGLTDCGKYFAPKLIYKTSDYWSMAVGGEYFLGDANSYLGQFKKNSGVYTEGRFAW